MTEEERRDAIRAAVLLLATPRLGDIDLCTSWRNEPKKPTDDPSQLIHAAHADCPGLSTQECTLQTHLSHHDCWYRALPSRTSPTHHQKHTQRQCRTRSDSDLRPRTTEHRANAPSLSSASNTISGITSTTRASYSSLNTGFHFHSLTAHELARDARQTTSSQLLAIPLLPRK
jgi:hypothetical protein